MVCKQTMVIFSTSRESLRIEDLLNPVDERWVQAPVESDDEDVAWVEVMKARLAEDEEDADDSDPIVVMTLKKAREMFVKGKCFLQENLQANPSLGKYLAPGSSPGGNDIFCQIAPNSHWYLF